MYVLCRGLVHVCRHLLVMELLCRGIVLGEYIVLLHYIHYINYHTMFISPTDIQCCVDGDPPSSTCSYSCGTNSASKYSISSNGVSLITAFEGFSSTCYQVFLSYITPFCMKAVYLRITDE